MKARKKEDRTKESKTMKRRKIAINEASHAHEETKKKKKKKKHHPKNKQNKTKHTHTKTKQNKTKKQKQNKTKQNKTKQTNQPSVCMIRADGADEGTETRTARTEKLSQSWGTVNYVKIASNSRGAVN